MGDFKSHGVAVCIPRQQQLQQHLQREAEEKADVVYMSAHFAISRTAASRVHLTWGLFGRAKSHSIIVHSAAGKLAVVGNGRGVIVGCLQQYQKTMGFRPDGIKSNGMAARTPWQAAATAAAGEVTER